MNPKKKAYFFDFDGTLVDSVPCLKELYYEYMRLLGQKGSEEEFEHLNGPNVSEISAYLKETYSLPNSTGDLKGLFHKLLLRAYKENVQFFPGALTFLRAAKKQGILCIVVTSAEPSFVELLFAKENAIGLLDGMVSSSGLPKGKPDPAVYEKALRDFSLSPAEVHAFEDSKNGLAAARTACIEMTHFTSSWEELLCAHF